MKPRTKAWNLISALLWVGLLLATHVSMAQQQTGPLWVDELDSMELVRLDRRAKLQATPPVQERVDERINQYRLLMLAYEWWGLPTDQEQRRLDKAVKSRYESYATSLENPAWREQLGTFYRTDDRVLPEQNVTVMGWHPYWEGDAYKTYNYRLLTHLAFYGYEINPFTGGYSSFDAIYELENSALVSTAHLDSCKVLLTVSNRGLENNIAFFTNEKEVRQNLIDSLITILDRTGIDGIDLNFEEVPYVHKYDFIDFVKELSFAVREANHNYVITMTVPMYDKDNIYDLKRLKPWVDLFVINSFNFHVQPMELVEGPLAPLHDEDASIRGTVCLYQIGGTLIDVLSSSYIISDVELQHDLDYENRLRDSLNFYIRRLYNNLEYKHFDFTDVLNTIKITRDPNGQPLWQLPGISRLLRRTNCVATLKQRVPPTRSAKETRFFLFKPKKDTLVFLEYDLFQSIAVEAPVDSHLFDLHDLVDMYKKKMGEDHIGSLLLGLPYHGAVWYKDRTGEKDFEGYMPYSEILRLTELGQASVQYNKTDHSLEATVRDSVGGVYKIYFDNSTSLGKKFDFAINEGLGGIGIWALGADYAHTGLWATIEQQFVKRRVWDKEERTYTRVTIDKENKVGYTIQYMLRRFQNLILATIFFITIFVCISFGRSVLDWKVRDVLFYSGSFRIFYLVIFTVALLVIGNWMSWFQSAMITFAIGTILGLLLTWVASTIVNNRHEELP